MVINQEHKHNKIYHNMPHNTTTSIRLEPQRRFQITTARKQNESSRGLKYPTEARQEERGLDRRTKRRAESLLKMRVPHRCRRRRNETVVGLGFPREREVSPSSLYFRYWITILMVIVQITSLMIIKNN